MSTQDQTGPRGSTPRTTVTGRARRRPVASAALAVGVVLAATAGLTAPIPGRGPTPTTTAPPPSTKVAPSEVGGGEPVEAAEAGGPLTVDFDGEVGDLAGVSTSANATVTSAAAKYGGGGLRLASTEAGSYARWGTDVVPAGQTHATTQIWVRVLSRGAGQTVDIVTVGNALQSANFDLFMSGVTQRFQWDLWREDTDQSDFIVELGRWYLIETRVEFSGTEHTAEVRIDGVSQGTIASAGTSTTVRMLTVGTTVAKTHSQDYDDIELQVDDAPLGWLADTPPSVSLARPAHRATYDRGQSVTADFGCDGGDHAVVSCVGTVADGVAIDTSSLGERSFTVTATDRAGYTATSTHTYTVVDAGDPMVELSSPVDGMTYTRGAPVTAAFACTDDPGGSGLAPGDGCVGSVADGAPIDTMALGQQSFAVTAKDNAGNTTTVAGTYTVVRNRPDAHIRRATAPRFAGDGVYGADGFGQTQLARIGARGEAVFIVRVQNDGEARSSFRVRGPRSDAKWTVRYLDGPRNVTGAVTAGTHTVDGLAPGRTALLRVVVRPTSRARRGDLRDLMVTVSARTQPGVADTVRAVIGRA